MVRKNVVLVAIDDGFAFWRYRTTFGATLQTPNLDRIMAQSTIFTSAYCQVPICGPSRASAMSGLSPFETGVLDNYISIFDKLRPEQMWQYRLKRAGYYCSTAGKVHHGFKPLARPYNEKSTLGKEHGFVHTSNRTTSLQSIRPVQNWIFVTGGRQGRHGRS